MVAGANWVPEIHIILDNLSAHKTKAVQLLLENSPKVHFHFTPTYSSAVAALAETVRHYSFKTGRIAAI